jgi:tetratricopeptide (TPR) repeat protein
MTTKTLTIGEAIKSINFLATNFMETNELDREALEISSKAISKNLLIRDYFMGMPKDFGLPFMTSLCKKMISEVDSSELLDLYAIYSAFLYEGGESELALDNLNKALEINDKHSLTELLVRVYEHAWEAISFSEMRSAIHSKVIAEAKKNANEEV